MTHSTPPPREGTDRRVVEHLPWAVLRPSSPARPRRKQLRIGRRTVDGAPPHARSSFFLLAMATSMWRPHAVAGAGGRGAPHLHRQTRMGELNVRATKHAAGLVPRPGRRRGSLLVTAAAAGKRDDDEVSGNVASRIVGNIAAAASSVRVRRSRTPRIPLVWACQHTGALQLAPGVTSSPPPFPFPRQHTPVSAHVSVPASRPPLSLPGPRR